MDNKILIKNIELFCDAKKITKADMLRDLNLPSSTISNWKNRNNLPALETICDIADYFKVPLDFLLFNEHREFEDDIAATIARLELLTKDQRKPLIDLINSQVDYWYKVYNPSN